MEINAHSSINVEIASKKEISIRTVLNIYGVIAFLGFLTAFFINPVTINENMHLYYNEDMLVAYKFKELLIFTFVGSLIYFLMVNLNFNGHLERRVFYLILILLFGLSILLAGYESYSNSNSDQATDWEPTKHEIVNNIDGVTMYVKKETVIPKGLTVTFESKSDKQFSFGEIFWLEKKIKGRWYQVPVAIDGNYAFTLIGYDITPLDLTEWTVDWFWLYGSLDTGKYRIIKDILEFRKPGDYDKYYLSAEFTVP